MAPERIAGLSHGLRGIAACGLDIGTGKIEVKRVKREDWAESWKRHFKPIRVGRALLVKPSWSRVRKVPGQAVMILDPGLSFGTGQHPTTGFCLREVVRARKAGAKSLMDIGTGSGILAIAAAKLSYTPIEAFDFDPESVRVAKENAMVNNAARAIKLSRADLTKISVRAPRRFDVVCANLMYDLLIAERKRIVNRLEPEGTLVLAGILATQFERVQQAYAELGFKLVRTRLEKEWQSGAFERV